MNTVKLTADVLCHLLQIHTDRIKAYKEALSKSKKLEYDLKGICEKMIEESILFKQHLSTELGNTESNTFFVDNISREIENEWTGTKAILTGDRRNILAGCELDEELVGNAYISALSSKSPLDSGIGQLLITQLEKSEVLRHHIKRYRMLHTSGKKTSNC